MDDKALEIQEKQQQAWELYNQIQQARVNEAKIYLVQGRLLKFIRDGELYKYLGEGGYDTFKDFLNNPEIGFSLPTAYLYIRIWEYFVDTLGLDEDEVVTIPLNRLQYLLPALKNLTIEDAKKALNDFKGLTHNDYTKEVEERKMRPEKPLLLKDKETGKYVLLFKNNQMLKIRNTDTGEVLLGEKE